MELKNLARPTNFYDQVQAFQFFDQLIEEINTLKAATVKLIAKQKETEKLVGEILEMVKKEREDDRSDGSKSESHKANPPGK